MQTTQAIVKETIEGRKNTSAQNIYEVTQLYAAGALKVAVIALQCVGFNQSMYHLLLEHASKCTSSAGNVGTTPEIRNNSSSTLPSVSLQTLRPTSIQSTTTKNFSSGASVLGNVNVNAGKNGTNANPSRNSSYSLGLGLGLGTGNIWNTNLGVGLAVGSTTRPAKKGLGKGGGPSSNSSSISHFIKAGPTRKTHGTTGDENDKPSGISAEIQTQIKT